MAEPLLQIVDRAAGFEPVDRVPVAQVMERETP